MHHEIEFDLSGSSLATVLTCIHNQVVLSGEQPKAQLLLTRRGGGAYRRKPLGRYRFENLCSKQGCSILRQNNRPTSCWPSTSFRVQTVGDLGINSLGAGRLKKLPKFQCPPKWLG